jgi:hypothetical protein
METRKQDHLKRLCGVDQAEELGTGKLRTRGDNSSIQKCVNLWHQATNHNASTTLFVTPVCASTTVATRRLTHQPIS